MILNSVVDMLVESHILIESLPVSFQIDLKTMKVLVVPRGSADIEGEEVLDGGCSRVCCSELSLLGSSNERISNFIV